MSARGGPSGAPREAIRTCPLCEATCGLSITLRGSTVERIAGDEQDVLSRGYLCPKGTTLGEQHDDQDRLHRPVVKKNGRFVETTWEEAFRTVAELFRPVLQEDGAEAVAVYLGNPIGHNLDGLLYPRVFLKALQTRNLYSASTLDQRPKDLANALLYGERYTLAVPDIDRTDFLLVLGANPMASNGSLATAPGWPRRLRALRRRGGELVVVDPLRTRTAELATQHLPVRAGSDSAFLLAIINTLFADDLVSLGRLSEFVTHVDDVAEAARRFTPEAVADHVGIPADTIRDLTHRLASAPTACVYGRIGTTTTRFGSICSWAIDVINILTGNLDRPGGAMFPKAATGSPNTRGEPRFGKPLRIGRHHTRVRRAPELFGELPTSCFAEEIDTPGPGRYRALLLVSGNPVVSNPSSSRVDSALRELDAFVAVDPYVNDSTRHAHVILPPPSALQRPHYDVHFTQWAVRNTANFSPRVLPLEDGQLDEWEIMCHLAAAFSGTEASAEQMDDELIASMVRSSTRDEHSPIHGREVEHIVAMLAPRTGPERIVDFLLRVGPYGDGFPPEEQAEGLTLRQVLDHPHGIDLGPMEPRLPEVLRTPDGMITLGAEMILEDLNRLWPEVTSAPGNDLLLIGRRTLRSNNSWMHNVPSLMTGRDRFTLLINPGDAADRGLTSGDTATLSTSSGRVLAPVEVTDRIAPGVVSLPHGFLHDPDGVDLTTARARPGANVNRLIDAQVMDVPSCTAVFNGVPVEVSRAAMPSPIPAPRQEDRR